MLRNTIDKLVDPLFPENIISRKATMQTFPENISQNFACILDPKTFPEKASPFYVFGGVTYLQHLQSNNFDECVLTNV